MSTCACPDPTTYEDDDGIERCWECGDTAAPMSTPRPTEADVDALARSVYQEPDLNLPLADSLDIDCHDVARAVLASDWFAEYQRGVEALAQALATAPSCEAQQACRAIARAEAAERDRDEARRELADLRAKVAALAADFDTAVGFRGAAASLRALLPTEDDQ